MWTCGAKAVHPSPRGSQQQAAAAAAAAASLPLALLLLLLLVKVLPGRRMRAWGARQAALGTPMVSAAAAAAAAAVTEGQQVLPAQHSEEALRTQYAHGGTM
jgi:hypothetical protein